MIAKAFINKVIDSNSCRVRIPIYHRLATSTGATPDEELPIATICTIPGIKFAPKVGDVVFVDFELDKVDNPIIIGYLSTDNIKASCNIEAQSLTVDVNCNLPSQVYKDINSSLYSTIDGLQNQIDNISITPGTGTVTSVSVKMNDTIKGTVTSEGTIDLGNIVTTINNTAPSNGNVNVDKLTIDNTSYSLTKHTITIGDSSGATQTINFVGVN